MSSHFAFTRFWKPSVAEARLRTLNVKTAQDSLTQLPSTAKLGGTMKWMDRFLRLQGLFGAEIRHTWMKIVKRDFDELVYGIFEMNFIHRILRVLNKPDNHGHLQQTTASLHSLATAASMKVEPSPLASIALAYRCKLSTRLASSKTHTKL